jgi:hypothetical protein
MNMAKKDLYVPMHQYMRTNGLHRWFPVGGDCRTFEEAITELRKPVDPVVYPPDMAYTKVGHQPIFTGNAVFKNGKQVSS